MAKWILAIVLIFLILGVWKQTVTKVEQKQDQVSVVESTRPPQKVAVDSTSLFMPYWNIPNDFSGEPYDRVFYFGISATPNGVNKNEAGYADISSFAKVVPNAKTYLTLRLLDADINLAILKSPSARKKVIAQTLETANQYGFKGVVLDLELSTLPFTDVQTSINQFVDEFYASAKQDQTEFLVALYGDTFYRKRPFDVNFIGTHSDGVLVMAYDFHKALGEPGPNFPLDGRQTYGYDFRQMVTDYLQFVPPEKLTVTFGMYGYDWVVDEKKRPIRRANALSLADIRKDFINSCEWKNCLVLPDAISGETEIDYVDSSSSEFAINHIVWFEDERSMSLKKAYLKQMGIGQTAIWVYGYF